MLSKLHEALVGLIHDAPVRFVSLAAALGIDVGQIRTQEARVIDPTIPALMPSARVCDVAIEVPLATPTPKGPHGVALIFEIQLRRDDRKNLSWPLYWAEIRARPSIRGGPVWLVVITTRRATERWAIDTLSRLLPAGAWYVLGPSTMRRVTEREAAQREPEVALMSALIHAGDRSDIELVPAIRDAYSTLPVERGMLMHDVIGSRLSKPALVALEAYMEKSGYVWQGEFARSHQAKGREEGRAEGREEGRAEGARRILLAILDRRSFELTRAQHRALSACSDVRQLERWSRRAVTATRVAEVFAVRTTRPSSARTTRSVRR